MISFLKRNAIHTTTGLVLLMVLVAGGGIASGKEIREIGGLLAFMVLFWPVLFVPMSLFTLLQPLYRGAAAFGSSLGTQAVNSPRKEAGAALREALGAIESGPPKSPEANPTRRVPSPAPPTTAQRNAPGDNAVAEGTPQEAKQMAARFVDLIQRKFEVTLNYSPETLAAVDLIVDKIKATGVSESDGSGMIYSVGCYVGEVFVRHAGGEWRPTAELGMQQVCSWPVAISMPSGAGVNPIGKAFKRFRNGDADSLAFFYKSTLRLPEILPSN
jgi:hypothetical protein